MKCFKLITLVFMLVQIVFATEYNLSPVDSNEYTTGDVVRLKVEGIGYEQAIKLKNSRISNLIYVLNILQKDGEVYFEAILSEDRNYKEKEDTFKLEGLNYRSVKLNLNKDIDIIDNKIILIKDKVFIIVSAFAAVLFMMFFINLYMKKKQQKRIIYFKKKKLNIYSEEISREHFEEFYLSRTDFKILYSYDKDAYENFENKLNEIQYKKYWSDEEYEAVASNYKKLILTVKDKNGV